MKEYELTVLFHPDLEMNLQPALDKVKALIEANGGEIIKESNEGKRKLAYAVKKQDFAVYYYYELKLPAAAPARVSSVLNITDEVIRYLLVVKDERKEKLSKRDAEESREDDKKEEK